MLDVLDKPLFIEVSDAEPEAIKAIIQKGGKVRICFRDKYTLKEHLYSE